MHGLCIWHLHSEPRLKRFIFRKTDGGRPCIRSLRLLQLPVLLDQILPLACALLLLEPTHIQKKTDMECLFSRPSRAFWIYAATTQVVVSSGLLDLSWDITVLPVIAPEPDEATTERREGPAEVLPRKPRQRLRCSDLRWTQSLKA